MKQIRFIIEQVEESKRLILQDDIPYFRTAFVLLDNAAEILMHRQSTMELMHNDFYRRMRETAIKGLDSEKIKKFDQEVKLPPIIDCKRERLIQRYFDEKTKFLSEDKRYIKKTTAAVLRSLHKYRNELYHNDTVREETIRASTILLFEIVCDLLLQLPPSGYSILSSENYNTLGWKRFFKKYQVKKMGILDKRTWNKVVKKLKGKVTITCRELREALKTHLLSRIDEAIQGVEFVMTDGLGEKSKERTLKYIQLVESGVIIGLRDSNALLRKFKAKYKMKDFEKWERRIDKFNNIRSKIQLFKVFSKIENEFEEIEKQIIKASSELDAAIQHEIDVARGK